MEPNNILKTTFLDILFEGRNKDYGAYTLRRDYPKRLTTAIGIAASVAVLLILFSFTLDKGGSNNRNLAKREQEMKKAMNEAPKIPKPKPIPPPPIKKPPPVIKVQMIKYTPPQLVKDIKIDPPKIDDDKAVSGNKDQEGVKIEEIKEIDLDKPNEEKPKEIAIVKEKDDVDKIWQKVEKEAEFLGFRSFLERNLLYPSDAEADGKEGVVKILFIVDANGNVSETQVSEDSPQKFPSLVNEAIRIIKKTSGKWAPGIQNGNKVKSWHEQSIKFVIPEG